MSEIDKILNNFDIITLDRMYDVKLMNRSDTKFIVQKKILPEILNDAIKDYFVFENSNKKSLKYNTTYFDTPDCNMYQAHHNGMLNRYKIRKRTYVETNETFIEIKFKNNKRKTKKQRIKLNGNNDNLEIKNYIKEKTEFDFDKLHPSLKNNFSRITLVSKLLNERVTIDYNIEFITKNGLVRIPDLIIIEQKKSGTSVKTHFSKILIEKRLFSSGFSKYCMGIVFTNNDVKKNRFKPKVQMLKKMNILTEYIQMSSN